MQGAPGTAGLGGSRSFENERVKLFGRTQALNSLEASYKVLIVTKMTQPPPSLRDLSAYALFHSSFLSLSLQKVSISRRETERLQLGSADAGFLKPDTYNCKLSTVMNVPTVGSFSYHKMNDNNSNVLKLKIM